MGSVLRAMNYTPTGCPTLDLLCGGGVPHESLIYLYGGPGLGKTTIALAMAAAIGSVVWVDAGHTFNPYYASSEGCTDVTIIAPTLVEAIDIESIILPLIGVTPLVVIDDLTSLSGDLAKPLEALVKKVVTSLPGSGTTLLITNHVRQCRNGYLPPGGLSPIKYGHLVLELGPRSTRVGDFLRVDIRVIKSTTGPCQGISTIPFCYGLAKNTDIITTAIRLGIVEQAGSWYRYKDIKVQGLSDLHCRLDCTTIGDIYLEVMKAFGYQ